MYIDEAHTVLDIFRFAAFFFSKSIHFALFAGLVSVAPQFQPLWYQGFPYIFWHGGDLSPQ